MQERALILFDGTCGLCSGAVHFLAKRDRAGRFRCAPLGSETARCECRRLGVDLPAPGPDTIVVAAGSEVWIRSDAVIEIARRLPWPWRAAVMARAVPRSLRDAAYRWVARHRKRWFGTTDACALPQAAFQAAAAAGRACGVGAS